MSILHNPLNESSAVPEQSLCAACMILAQAPTNSWASPERILCRSCSPPPNFCNARCCQMALERWSGDQLSTLQRYLMAESAPSATGIKSVRETNWSHLIVLLKAQWVGIATGVLGGFTTFSSFSIDTLMLFQTGQHWNAVLNIILNVVLCLIGVGLGVWLGQHLLSLCPAAWWLRWPF